MQRRGNEATVWHGGRFVQQNVKQQWCQMDDEVCFDKTHEDTAVL